MEKRVLGEWEPDIVKGTLTKRASVATRELSNTQQDLGFSLKKRLRLNPVRNPQCA
jgi:hypothetical protein